jgi:phospholipase/carboxylesterase
VNTPDAPHTPPQPAERHPLGDVTAWPLDIDLAPATGAAQQLILLLHGWADSPRTLQPLALALHGAFPQAAVVAPRSPLAADGGRAGQQWYSLDGLAAPGAWRQRIDSTLPAIVSWVRHQQRRHGVDGAPTALGGFSQGGVLALHAACAHDGLCGRVLAFGARMADLPPAAPQHSTLHLFHGGQDRVFAPEHPRALLDHLGQQGGDATLDVADGVGHALHPALVDCALHRLTHHIPLRTWREALGAAPGRPGSAAH